MTTITRHDDVHILNIDGGLIASSVGEFKELAETAMANDARDFIVNLQDCTSLDSAALEALTWLQRECTDRLGMCKLCMLSETLEKILEMTRLDRQLDVCLSLDEAIESLK